MRFGASEVPFTHVTRGSKLLCPDYTELHKAGVNKSLIYILSDVTTFVRSLNNIDETNRSNPLDFSEQAFSLIQRLIGFAPLQGLRPNNRLDNLLQLALLALMTTTLPHYTPEGPRYELLAELLKGAIQCYVSPADDHRRLLLWAVFVGRVSILRFDQDESILPLMQDMCQRLEMRTWPQVQRALHKYGWLHISHDEIAMNIWEQLNKSIRAGILNDSLRAGSFQK